MSHGVQSHRIELALAEHSRLHREIDRLERGPLDPSERELLASLRMCLANVARELLRSGLRRQGEAWSAER